MKRVRAMLVMLTVLAGILAPLSAQEKSNTDAKPPTTTLKVQVTIAETDGRRKLSTCRIPTISGQAREVPLRR